MRGHWVKRGLIRMWVGERAVEPPRLAPNPTERQRTRRCPGCTASIRPGRQLCADCRAKCDRMPALIFPGRPLCGCGCLLAHAGENCPNCALALGAQEGAAA